MFRQWYNEYVWVLSIAYCVTLILYSETLLGVT